MEHTFINSDPTSLVSFSSLRPGLNPFPPSTHSSHYFWTWVQVVCVCYNHFNIAHKSVLFSPPPPLPKTILCAFLAPSTRAYLETSACPYDAEETVFRRAQQRTSTVFDNSLFLQPPKSRYGQSHKI